MGAGRPGLFSPALGLAIVERVRGLCFLGVAAECQGISRETLRVWRMHAVQALEARDDLADAKALSTREAFVEMLRVLAEAALSPRAFDRLPPARQTEWKVAFHLAIQQSAATAEVNLFGKVRAAANENASLGLSLLRIAHPKRYAPRPAPEGIVFYDLSVYTDEELKLLKRLEAKQPRGRPGR